MPFRKLIPPFTRTEWKFSTQVANVQKDCQIHIEVPEDY